MGKSSAEIRQLAEAKFAWLIFQRATQSMTTNGDKIPHAILLRRYDHVILLLNGKNIHDNMNQHDS